MRVVAFDIGLKNFAFAVMDDGQHLVSMDVHDLRGQNLYHNLVCYLKQYTYLWETVDVVLIEQQLNRMNIQATKLACHVHAYFIHCHPSIPVLEYPSLYKTKYTSFPIDHSTHRQRKQYAIQQVLEQYQKDPVFLDWISNFPKKDDVCDCILMCQTFPSTPLYRNYCLTFLSTGRSNE